MDMLELYNRDKLINAIIYFAKNTKYCGVTKLFKLLYFLDFEHYQEIGRSVTGLDYYAWKMGPVPVSLYDEVSSPDKDFVEKIRFEPVQTKFGNPMYLVRPKADFDSTHFSKRELKLLKKLSKLYEKSQADDIVEATHLENLPWNKVYNEEKNMQGLIPYEYAIRKSEDDFMKHLITENDEMINNYK
jgi:uncharacterized phage-associated protein